MKKYICLLATTFIILCIILLVDQHFTTKRHKSPIEKYAQPQLPPPAKYYNNLDTAQAAVPAQISASKIPIIMYHSISNQNPANSLCVSPKSFKAQINYLIESHYNFIDFEDLDKNDIPKNPVLLTFDDGYEDFYTNAYPILQKANLKATVFIITDNIGKPGYLDLDEIKIMSGLISFQSHTVSHIDLRLLNDNDLDKELQKSKEILEEITNSKIIAISYPSGAYNSNVINISKKHYKYAVTTIPGTYNIKNSKYTIPRIRVSGNEDLETFTGTVIKQ